MQSEMVNYKDRQTRCINAVELKYSMVPQEGLRGISTGLEGVEGGHQHKCL